MKQLPLTPVLIDGAMPQYRAVENLQEAISNDEFLNIAVTGPYGSGKSSVIRTFINNLENSNDRVLDISLATLDADASIIQENVSNKHGKNNKSEKNAEILNRKIEYSILQQLLYRKASEALPYSRMKKIRHFSSELISKIAKYIIFFFLLFCISFKPDWIMLDQLYEIISMPHRFHIVVQLLSLLLLFLMLYDIIKYFIRNYGGMKLARISVGHGEINMNDEGSIFNRYLDEILYFFQCTKYDIVVIEDLDRFDNIGIFLKLRELNFIINKSESINRNVKFIYAVKDDLFVDSSRTKFFDYITTVIPIITPYNSKDKLIEFLNTTGHSNEIENEDIKEIAFFISDMRLLTNIVNEYDQYVSKLNNEDHSFEFSNMLAWITIKNYHPHHFSLLHKNKGPLYEVFSRTKRNEYIDFAINKRIKDRETLVSEKLYAFEQTNHLSANELRQIYIDAYVSQIGKPIVNFVIDGNNCSVQQIVTDETLFDKLIESDDITFYYQDNSSVYPNKGEIIIEFTKIEQSVNKNITYKKRLNALQEGKEAIVKEIEAIRLEKTRVKSYTVRELVEKFDIYKDDIFKSIGLSDMEEAFVRFGLITEDYNEYISFFYPGTLTESDHQLCLDIKLKREIEQDYVINNVEAVINELPKSVFREQSVWIFSIADFLSLNSAFYKDQTQLLIENLANNNSSDFFFNYLSISNQAKLLYAACIKNNPAKMWMFASQTANKEQQNFLAICWLNVCSIEEINDIQKEWIESNYNVIAQAYTQFDIDKQNKLTSEYSYKKLSGTSIEMLKKVVANSCYVLCGVNIPFIVEMKKAIDDISQLNDIEEMHCAIWHNAINCTWNNVLSYFQASENKVDKYLIKLVTGIDFNREANEDMRNNAFQDLFKKLLECQDIEEDLFDKLCNFIPYKIDLWPNASLISEPRLIKLIQSDLFKYSVDILKRLNIVSKSVAAEYIYHYKENIQETLQSGVLGTELAEILLMDGRFNQVEIQYIISMLTPQSVNINQIIANKICITMALQNSACEPSILLESVRLCSNESDAVMTVARRIARPKTDFSVVDSLLSSLPEKYHVLSTTGVRPRFENNPYNKFLINTLSSIGYISSYNYDDKTIYVNLKRVK